MSLQTNIFRIMCKKNDAKRDAGLTVPDDIVTHRDLQYGNDPKQQILDIYRPAGTNDKLPVIVNFHGGGWVYGTKETYQFYCMFLAQQGFAVVNPTYRLAPEYRFPAAMEDLNAVFAFVMQHAAEYGLDTTNLFGIGDSAGATGMAAYAALLADSEYAANYPFTPPAGLKLRAIALNCGTFSMDDMLEPMRDVLPQTEPEKALHLLDIPKHITAGFPPCYLMTAYGDFNCNQPMKLFAELKYNNIPYQYKVWGDKNNPLGHVFHCNLHDPAAHDANKAETDFFHSYIQN